MHEQWIEEIGSYLRHSFGIVSPKLLLKFYGCMNSKAAPAFCQLYCTWEYLCKLPYISPPEEGKGGEKWQENQTPSNLWLSLPNVIIFE